MCRSGRPFHAFDLMCNEPDKRNASHTKSVPFPMYHLSALIDRLAKLKMQLVFLDQPDVEPKSNYAELGGRRF